MAFVLYSLMLFGNVSKTQKALKSGGASDSMIDDLINASLRNLREQGVTAPTRIPWHSK